MSDDTVFLAIELDSMEREERFRRFMRSEGHVRALAEYNAKMREIRSGVDSAKNIWHSISSAQRRVLREMSKGWMPTARLPTMRSLCARDLVAPDGALLDPESKFALTEHGRFVVAHGPQTPAETV